MLNFCGIDRCLIDANGRIKFSPRVLDDFARSGNAVVLHCLPEGALAVYPEEVFLQMRKAKEDAAEKAASSVLFRRELRRFGAWSMAQSITGQGRITLPPEFREFSGIAASDTVVVVGVEIGVEIWNRDRWLKEQQYVMEHAREKGENEMISDLQRGEAEE